MEVLKRFIIRTLTRNRLHTTLFFTPISTLSLMETSVSLSKHPLFYRLLEQSKMSSSVSVATINDVALRKWQCSSMVAFVCALLSAIAGALILLLNKYIEESDTDHVLMSQWIVHFLLSLPIVTWRKGIFIDNNKTANILLFVRAATGVAATHLLYLSVKVISAGDASSISFIYSVLVGLFSCVLLKGKDFLVRRSHTFVE